MIYSIEDQAFFDCMIRLLAHPLPLLSRQLVVSFSHSSCVSPVELTDERGGRGGGRGAKSYDGEKAWPSINYSILSGRRFQSQI
jgi:hypothetical protein